MANDPKPKADSGLAANPSVDPETHNVNPSAPTVGTEGWGTTSDERRALAGTEPEAVQPGQVKRDPGTDQAEPTRVAGATAASMNVTHGGRDRTFRCADVGNADCRWETSGASDDEIFGEVHRHGQTEHGWKDWTEALRNRVRDAIRERRAA